MKRMTKTISAVLCGAAIASLSTSAGHAYTTYAKWGSNQVTFYVNPSNADIDPTLAESALVSAMDVWTTQGGTPLRYLYGGRVNDTSTGYDSRNVMVFRNASNGSAIATTYSWYSGSTLVDADIVFWDAAFGFTASNLGCSGKVYVEDVATHELGHALGLNHSSVSGATMYPSYNYCSTQLRTLEPDDIAGAQSLYGSKTTTNTPPTVSISSPTSTSFTEGVSITFAGSASDTQDGSLTSQIVWTSSLLGQIGAGGSFGKALTVGTHVITARATDSAGLTTSRQITVSISAAAAAPQPGVPVLTASGYKVKGSKRVDLLWSGFASSNVDVFRNGVKVSSTPNDGTWTDAINTKGGGSYEYTACATGSTTCSNQAAVTF